MERIYRNMVNILITMMLILNLLIYYGLIEFDYTPWWVWIIDGILFIFVNYEIKKEA